MAERVQCLYRVSTTKQVDHNDQNQANIPMQRKACRGFAKKMGWIIVGEEQETGVSGFKVSADDRDKLQLVKEKAEQKKFDILLVYMFDRLFDMAQNLMTERTNENKEYRTMPLNTTGQSLLSGNVFCGHCGGRLVLTTNGKVYRQPDGTPLKKKRFRYICYNKTRHRTDCDGQTGYTMHILDDIVVNILHQVFDKMKSATSDMIVGNACQKQMALLQADLKRARTENTKANTDYESLKAEVLKAVQGKSALPMDVLNELLEETRQRVLDTSRRVTELTMELEDENSKLEEFRSEFERIATWSEIFDSSDTATKKMICGYIIKRVTVCRDYKLAVDFTINVEQFLNGIDSVTQAEVNDLPMAQ